MICPLSIVATHATDVNGPPDALTRYLLQRGDWVAVIRFPLSSSDNVIPSCRVYHHGQLVEEWTAPKSVHTGPRSYLGDVARAFFWSRRVLKTYRQPAVFIGCNNLLALTGLLLKRLGSVKASVFYAIDYSDARFSNRVLNRIYLAVDAWASRFSDGVWSNTNRTREIRRRQGVLARRNVLVPNGVFTEDIVAAHETDRGDGPVALEYHGYLSETKGVQHVLRALSLLDRCNYTFDIMGSGEYEPTLRLLIDEYNLTERVSFLGRLSNKDVVNRLGCYDLSIALINDKEDYVRYCDPMKVKEALSTLR